jgi:hypothetical protein
MEHEEFISKKNTLLNIIQDLKLQYVYSKTNLRIGDTVKFTVKGDSYIGKKDIVYTEKIYDFDVFPTTKTIYAKCGNHQSPNIENCKKVLVKNQKSDVIGQNKQPGCPKCGGVMMRKQTMK